MKVGQRIAKLLDSDRVYEKKADGTEVLNREKTLEKNEAARAREVDQMLGDGLGAVSLGGAGTVFSLGTAATLSFVEHANGLAHEPSVMSAVMVGLGLIPGAVYLGRAAVQGLMAAKDSIDHAVYAHQLAKDAIHTP